jgi:hypothetical protein
LLQVRLAHVSKQGWRQPLDVWIKIVQELEAFLGDLNLHDAPVSLTSNTLR